MVSGKCICGLKKMEKNVKIYIAGHRGLVGTALFKRLKEEGYNNILVRTSEEMDLVCQSRVEDFIVEERPEVIVIVAAKHGGIQANLKHKPEYLYDNTLINFNIIHAALKAGCRKIINISASCVYPEIISRPFSEDMFLAGPVQYATEGYAWAKAMGIRYCQLCNEKYGTRYISLLPVNLYGENMTFAPENAGVLAGMLMRFHGAVKKGAEEVYVWGNGQTKREFLHVDDLVNAICMLMDTDCQHDIYNVGSGEMVSIQELASICAKITGYEGKIVNDLTKPNGASRQKLDCTRIRTLGWKPSITLEEGICALYEYVVKTGGLPT